MKIILRQEDLIKMVKKQIKSIIGNQNIKIEFRSLNSIIDDLTVQMGIPFEHIELVDSPNDFTVTKGVIKY